MGADSFANLQDNTGKADYELPKNSQAAPESPSDLIHGANGTANPDEKDRWERVGWAPRFGSGDTGGDDETTMLDHQTWLEGKLDDKYYGGMVEGTQGKLMGFKRC